MASFLIVLYSAPASRYCKAYRSMRRERIHAYKPSTIIPFVLLPLHMDLEELVRQEIFCDYFYFYIDFRRPVIRYTNRSLLPVIPFNLFQE